jgi:hypothetical protein
LKICKRGLRHPLCSGRHNLEVNACNWETACLGLPQRIRTHNHIRDLSSPAFAHRHLDSEELHTTSQVQFIRPHKFAATVFNLSDNAKRHAIV